MPKESASYGKKDFKNLNTLKNKMKSKLMEVRNSSKSKKK